MPKIFIVPVLFLFAEFYLIGQVMDHLGVLLTLLILVMVAMMGSRLVKQEGVATLRNLALKLQTGAAVGLEIVEGGLLLIAGFLFIFPGFLSDILAIFLLFSPIRRLVALLLARSFLQNSAQSSPQTPFTHSEGTIIEGEAKREADSAHSPLLGLPPPEVDPIPPTTPSAPPPTDEKSSHGNGH